VRGFTSDARLNLASKERDRIAQTKYRNQLMNEGALDMNRELQVLINQSLKSRGNDSS
jgi:hypothetical protein